MKCLINLEIFKNISIVLILQQFIIECQCYCFYQIPCVKYNVVWAVRWNEHERIRTQCSQWVLCTRLCALYSAVYTRLCTLQTPHPTGTCAVISFTQLQPFVSIIKACVTIKHSECINVVILFKRTCNTFNHFTITFVAVFPSNSRFAFINVKFIVLINFFAKPLEKAWNKVSF